MKNHNFSIWYMKNHNFSNHNFSIWYMKNHNFSNHNFSIWYSLLNIFFLPLYPSDVFTGLNL